MLMTQLQNKGICAREATNLFAAFDPAQQIATLSPEYLLIDSQRNAGLEPVFWTYCEGQAIFFHGFHMASIPETEYRDVQSPYSYGGPLCNADNPGFLQRAWDSYKSWCQENSVVAEFIRFHPVLGNWILYGGEAVTDRMTVWIDLKAADLLATYETRVRTAVRKAVKNGLQVEWQTGAENARCFAKLYSDAMRRISAAPFYFFPEHYFRSLLQWGKARLAVCRRDGEILAAAIFLFGPQVAEYHLSAANALGRQLGALNLILHEAGQFAREMGCRILYLGGGTDSRPENPLFFFKAGFSGKRAEFRIAKHIHCPASYAVLQQRFAAAYQAQPNRVLFYR